MKKLEIKLNEKFGSFEKDFSQELVGDLILLSGVNGSGKTQLMKIIYGRIQNVEPKKIINRKLNLDSIKIETNEVLYKSFRDYLGINNLTAASIATREQVRNQLWRQYNKPNNLEPEGFNNSYRSIKKIMIDKFGEEAFNQKRIKEDEFIQEIQPDFVLYQDNIFDNKIGEIFFNYTSKIHHEKVKAFDAGGKELKNSLSEIAPWTELNNLFKYLEFDYRFKNNYYRTEADIINEQPALYSIDSNGEVDDSQKRSLSDLSDGEKAIISLTFAVLAPKQIKPKILLLDEYDATLNPSLTEALFKVIQQYFVDRGVLVIMATHSIDTLMLAPARAKLYQIYKPNSVNLNRIEPFDLDSNKDSDTYNEYQKIRQKFFSTWDVEKSNLLKIKKELSEATQPLIITEGKTDWKYLIKALEYFHKKNEFKNIKVGFFYKFETDDMGDTKLEDLLKSFIKTSNFNSPLINHPIIGIFDSDNPKIKVPGLNSGRVNAIQISDTKKISTEFLFSNNETELKKEIGGRRLYTSDEFSSKTLKLKAQNEINTIKINAERLKKLEEDNL